MSNNTRADAGDNMLVLVEQDMAELKGPAFCARDIGFALQKSGRPLTVVSHRRPASLLFREDQDKSDFAWVPMPREPSIPPLGQPDLPRKLVSWAVEEVRGIYRKERIKRMTSTMVFINRVNEICLRTSWRMPGKKIQIVQMEPKEYSGGFARLNLEWAVNSIRKADGVVFVSTRCRDKWLKTTRIDAPVYYIHNCCAEELVMPLLEKPKPELRERLGLSSQDFIAVCPATLYARKNQGLLVDMFSRLQEEAPDLKIYLIGLKLQDGDEILEKIEASPFKEKILYLGPRRDALEYIYAADVLMLPSLSEGMPRSVLEAMALKTPVIASDVGGIPELVDDKETGFLFSHDRPQDMVTALGRLYKEPELRREMAEKASQKYWSDFSRELLEQRYNKLIQDFI